MVSAAAVALLLAGCAAPTEDVNKAHATAKDKLGDSLTYFGSNWDELDAFVVSAVPTLPDKILLNSQGNGGPDSDREFINNLQRVTIYMDQSKAPPGRFLQLCERLRFAFIYSFESDYHFARVQENICVRGLTESSQASLPPAPAVPAAASGDIR